MIYTVIISLLTIFAFALSPIQAQAATATPTPACAVIYGGGAIDCAKMKQAIVKNVQSTPTPQPANQATTKGGLPVYEPTQTRTTPSTGPEAWALVSLLPMAGAGIWLKKRM